MENSTRFGIDLTTDQLGGRYPAPIRAQRIKAGQSIDWSFFSRAAAERALKKELDGRGEVVAL